MGAVREETRAHLAAKPLADERSKVVRGLQNAHLPKLGVGWLFRDVLVHNGLLRAQCSPLVLVLQHAGELGHTSEAIGVGDHAPHRQLAVLILAVVGVVLMVVVVGVVVAVVAMSGVVGVMIGMVFGVVVGVVFVVVVGVVVSVVVGVVSSVMSGVMSTGSQLLQISPSPV